MDYACFWADGEEAEKICEELKALNIEPCTGSNTQEKNFFEAVEYGCTLFTENDPKSMIEWRKLL
ncbi:MAG: hypothetical protein U0L88_01080 [Acutalibacteraceae bacterium]|nr:hypothetical protein [Acutalibacteraceae bacterium]